MPSFARSLKKTVIGAARLLGRFVLAMPLYIIGISMLLIGVMFVYATVYCVFITAVTPRFRTDLGTGAGAAEVGCMSLMAAYGAGFTWGGAKVWKAANMVVRKYPSEDCVTTELAVIDSLLRASSNPAAEARGELLRPATEIDTPAEQLVRGSQR